MDWKSGLEGLDNEAEKENEVTEEREHLFSGVEQLKLVTEHGRKKRIL